MSARRDQSEVERSRAGMLRIVTVAEVDLEAGRARVTLDTATSAPLPWITTRAGGDRSFWAPVVGEQVMLLNPDGLPESGVILGGIYSEAHDAPRSTPSVSGTLYEDSAVDEYDVQTHTRRIELPCLEHVTMLGVGDELPGTLILTAPTIILRGNVLNFQGGKAVSLPYCREFPVSDDEEDPADWTPMDADRRFWARKRPDDGCEPCV